MKTSDLAKRLIRDRPMTSVTLRMPEDVVEDLKRVVPLLGFSGYQPLIRQYIGQGLRADLARLEDPTLLGRLVESLKRHGADDAPGGALGPTGGAWGGAGGPEVLPGARAPGRPDGAPACDRCG